MIDTQYLKSYLIRINFVVSIFETWKYLPKRCILYIVVPDIMNTIFEKM